MENSIKVICNKATFIGKSHLNTHLSKSSSLLVGSVNNKSLGNNHYISILNFDISELQSNHIKKAYLFLFVEEVRVDYKGSWNLGILGNFENIDISTVEWSNLPQKNYTKLLNHSIQDDHRGSYLRVDVTSLIKSLVTYDRKYNIILIPPKGNSNSVLKLASSSSNYAPYLDIVTSETNELDLSEDFEIETYVNESIETNTKENKSNNVENTIDPEIALNETIDDYKNQENNVLTNDLLNKVIDILKNQDLQFSSCYDFSTHSINSLANKLSNIDNRIEDLNGRMINISKNDIEALNTNISTLNSEVLKLRNSVDPLNKNVETLKTNINNFQNEINSKTDSFNEAEKSDSVNLNSINYKLEELSSNLNSLVKMFSSITIEPIN